MPIQRDRGGWERNSSCQMSKHGPIGSWPESRDKGRERITSKGPLRFEKEMRVKETPAVSAPEKPWGLPKNGLSLGLPTLHRPPCIGASAAPPASPALWCMGTGPLPAPPPPPPNRAELRPSVQLTSQGCRTG